jgi:hypothetical protein
MRTPNKGQPIDYSYIKEIVDAINTLQNEAKKTSSLLNLATKAIDSESPTKDAVIVTRYVEVSMTDIKADTTVDFGGSFTTVPVVTATIISTNDSNDPEKTTLALENITSTGVKILLNSLEKKAKKVGISIIAIGQHKTG